MAERHHRSEDGHIDPQYVLEESSKLLCMTREGISHGQLRFGCGLLLLDLHKLLLYNVQGGTTVLSMTIARINRLSEVRTSER